MARHLSLFGFLLVFWALLSGQLDLGNAGHRYLCALGVLSCAGVTWLASRKGLVDREGHPVHLVIRAIGYAPWLFWQIVLSNWDVLRRVWSPRLPIAPRMVTMPYETEDDLATVIVANSITLTPGTVTVVVDTQRREMLVHALSAEAVEGLKPLHDRVRRMETSP